MSNVHVLRPVQQDAKTRIDDPSFQGLMIVAPTGAGKTKVVEFVVPKGKTILIGPLRALSFQQYRDFSTKWQTILDTGDVHTLIDRYEREWDLAIMTYERFDSILRSESKRDKVMNDVEYVVVDEIHQIGRDRGVHIESALFKVKNIYPSIKIIGLSATIQNPETISGWLSIDLLKDTSPRPVPLQTEFYTYEFGGNILDNQVKILNGIFASYPNESFLIFCATQAHTHDLACMDAKVSVYQKNPMPLLIAKGVGYHHRSVDVKDRQLVEKEFENRNVKHLYATTTLAYGVNLPARHVVIFDVTRWSWLKSEAIYLGVDELAQMMGRAGRMGFDDKGFAHIICSMHQLRDMQQMVKESFVVKSQMRLYLREILLELITSRVIEKEDQISQLTTQFYCGKNENPLSEQELKDTFGWLMRNGFLQTRGRFILPTHKGRMTSLMYITPETVKVIEKGHSLMIQLQVQRIHLPNKLIFSLLLHSNEFLDLVTIRNTEHDQQLVEIGRREIGMNYCKTCKQIISQSKQCCSGQKISLCPDSRMFKAYALIFSKDLGRKYGKNISVSKSDRTTLVESGKRLLYAGIAIIPDKGTAAIVRAIIKMMERETLDEKIIELYKVVGIGEKYIDKLKKVNIHTIKELLNSDKSVLLGVFNSEKVITRIIDAAKQAAM